MFTWRRVSVVACVVIAGACSSSAPAKNTVAVPTTSSMPATTSTATSLHSAERRNASSLQALTIAAPTHQGSYNRNTDFGGWIDVDGCKNTRAELLIRSSHAPVTFTSMKDCTVKSGRWTDPWSNTQTTAASDLQIDHTVPLANAWASGAWAWTHARRVAYANDLADTDHLVPILDAENEAKGDDGPEAWRPPDRSAWCRYALDWDRIKAKWHLTATQTEWNALEQMAATC